MNSENFNVKFGEVINTGGTNDFNNLNNRPKYDNEEMTGETNIPKVPTTTSELTNNSGFITETELGAETTAREQSDNTLQGEIDGLNNSKADKSTTYTKTEVDTALDAKADKSTTYTKTEVDTALDSKADKSTTYTKTEADALLGNKQNKLTAGANVQISANNEISATDTTYSDFTGTDGTAAGNAGLVPAPATTDADKFLKSDGTWAEVGGGGGGITKLTTADYNYHRTGDADDGVALWLLEPGVYYSDGNVMWYLHSTANYSSGSRTIVIVAKDSSRTTYLMLDGNREMFSWELNNADGTMSNSRKNMISTDMLKQDTGTSTTGAMSQNAVTSMVFADPSTKEKVQIGSGAIGSGSDAIAVGHTAIANETNAITIGKGRANANGAISIGNHQTSTSGASAVGSIAIGYGATASDVGVMSINTNNTAFGYNNSNYRLLTGLYDGQSAHDAVTVGQITPTTDFSAPTAATAGRLGEIRIDTTTNTAYMCVVSDSTTPAYEWKQITA